MTDDLEDSAQWRGSIESRMGRLETAAAEEKVALKDQADLRAAMDKDMADLGVKFRAQEKLMQAVAKTQSDHTGRLTRLEDGQKELRTELGLVRIGVEAIQILLTGLTANETPEDDRASGRPVDADPDALP